MRTDRLAALALIAVVVAFWSLRFVFPDDEFIRGASDLRNFFYPLYELVYGWASEGRSVLWNPYPLTGYPQLAALQAGLFYPPHVLHLLLPTHLALAASHALHLCWLALTTAWLLRRVGVAPLAAGVAGAVFVLRGAPQWWLLWPAMLEAGSWLPLGCIAVLEIVRGRGTRGACGLALCAGMPLLAGHAQVAGFLVWTWALLWIALVLADRPAPRAIAAAGLRFAGALAAGVAVSAAQTLPSFELTLDGTRNLQGLPASQVLAMGAGGFRSLADFVFASRFSSGPVALSLALVALVVGRHRAWVWWATAVAAASCAIASISGELGVEIYRSLPGIGWFRSPRRILFMTHFGVAVAAGIGLDALLGRTRGATARVAAAVAVIAVLVDLGLANVTDGRLPYDAASAAAYRRHATFYSELGRSLGSARAVWLPQIRAIDIKLAGRFGLRRLDDTEPLNLRRQSEYFTYFQHGRSHMPDAKRFFAGEVIPEWRLPVDELSSRFADMAGRRRLLDLAAVAAFVTPREIGSAQRASSVAFAERAGLDPPDWKAEFAVRRNPHALPRAFVTHRVKPAPDTDKLLGLLADPSFDPLVFSYAEGDVAIPVTPLTPTRGHPAQIAVDEHTVVEVEAEVPAPGLLVLADAYFRGWRAEIDGEPAPIVAVNHLFRGVAVSRGRHRVRFEYRPLSVPIGIGVSLAAVGLIGFGFARSRG